MAEGVGHGSDLRAPGDAGGAEAAARLGVGDGYVWAEVDERGEG